MTRTIFVAVFFLLALSSSAQMEDYIILKKPNNRHVNSYFKGSRISLQRADGQLFDGIIESIRNDSVFIRQWQVRTYMTQFGTTRVDTAGYLIYGMHYQEIFSIIPNKKDHWKFVKNGSIFMIGGAGYALVNVINGAYLDEPIDDPDNLKSLGIALGIAGGGFILNRIYHSKKKRGKLYKIEYKRMTDR